MDFFCDGFLMIACFFVLKNFEIVPKFTLTVIFSGHQSTIGDEIVNLARTGEKAKSDAIIEADQPFIPQYPAILSQGTFQARTDHCRLLCPSDLMQCMT